MSLRQACGVQGEILFAEIDHVRIAYSRRGQGRSVVCLHAIAHGGRDFERFTELMQQDYEIICIDWPNHGYSGEDAEQPSARRYAEILVRFLDQIEVSNPIILGNSVSGAVALLYAQQKPVRALVLCDSAGLVPVNAFVRVICRLFAAFFDAGAKGKTWFARAYRFYYEYIVLPSAEAKAQRERIIDSGTEQAALLRDAWRGFGQPNADLRAIATALDVPVLCVWAAQDRVIPLWMCKPTIKKMRQTRLITFPAGHAVFLERPHEFATVFRDFANNLR